MKLMMQRNLAPLLLVFAFLLVLVPGCGGGVGTGGTGSFASGPITGFGSVIVGDVRFDDSAALVEDGDGVRRSRDDLRLGMTVEIEAGAVSTDGAGVASASASRIRYDSELRGPVGSVDVAGASFTVLGQRVTVDTTTVFAQMTGGLAALRPGTTVEVFGVIDTAAARYRAKRVALANAADTPRLRGLVAQVDTQAATLRVGSATYSYAGVAGVPADLAAGQLVRLRVAAQQQPSGRWSAQGFGAALQMLADADGARVEGLITNFVSAGAFNVNGRPVDASAASFPDGRAGLAAGARVDVRGKLRGGVLQADQVRIESDQQDSDRDFELHGAVESVDVAGQAFVLRGLTISTARADLRYENGSAANLVVGRRVEVRGRLAADQLRIEAARIKFE